MESYILLMVGLVFFYWGIILRRSTGRLLKSGKVAEGVVFDFADSEMTNSQVRYPVIRFVTSDQKWITEKSSTSGFPALQKGQKVSVLYNPDNPKEFIIRTKMTRFTPYLIFILATMLLVAGIFQILHIQFNRPS